jgi:hypothetical protein
LSICNDNNFLWVGIAQKGLYLFDKRSYVFEGHFKKQLRLTNITSINKVGGKLLLKTKSNNNFVVDLSDTSLHSSSLNDPIKDKFNDFVSYQGQKYQASSTGLFVRKANSNGDDLVAVKDTSAQVLQKDTIDQQESKLVSSVIVKQDKLIKNDQRTDEQEKDVSAYLWMLIPVLFLYSFLLIKVVSRKYNKDIKILEDEILKKKKQD